jgi:hypothetical protein
LEVSGSSSGLPICSAVLTNFRNLKVRQMSWLLGRKSKLSLENNTLIYKCILKPIWMYGIQLWGCAKSSNTKIIQRLQSNVLRTITNAPWYCMFQTSRYILIFKFHSSQKK